MVKTTNDRKKKTIAGNEVTERCVYLIHFKDGEETKWGHALIDSLDKDTVRFRTASGAKPIEVKYEDVLEICTDEKKYFDVKTVLALYRGEIYVDSKRATESPEYIEEQEVFYGTVN